MKTIESKEYDLNVQYNNNKRIQEDLEKAESYAQ